ncbi:SpoIIE family protein phosphatase [Streptomyces sp. GESEQ-35]|uniref:SpoIIE family protein phosphatase n=1 Tax=Streptomyces sp. GESEQ-35 TaxID=2812657 RepID=UPI001FF4BE16|nr:SpoIIE family protein phosphatase [Streptomyces sp. GESEQ-35]
MALLHAIDDDVAVTEALRLALEHAVAELRGVGGMVHVGGPEGLRGLHLLASSGLPTALTEPWERVPDDGDLPPVRAVREGTRIWLPAGHAPDVGGRPGEDRGVATVPLPGPDGPLGALTVLTTVRHAPRPAQWTFLHTVAAWVSGRLDRPLLPKEPAPWERQPGTLLRQALEAVHVGSWEWTMATDEVDLDAAGLTVLGFEPDGFDGRAETWLGIVHPDDRPLVAAEVDKALRDRSSYGTEYRVRRPDGTIGWVHARGRVKLADTGQPVGMVGTVWDSTDSRSARDAISRALRHMSDGFLTLDHQWRITFLNEEAERVLGAGQELIGRLVWDDLTALRVPGLRALCEEAVARSTPSGLDLLAPGTGRWCHLRLVPLPDGLAFFFTDIHEKRMHDTEREAAARAQADRAARIGELTAALAKAISSRDVVDAVASHVLPPFGAAGLMMEVIEDERTRVVGSVGYSQEFIDLVDHLPVTGRSAVTDALFSRTPQFFTSPQEYAARYPMLAGQPAAGGKAAWAFLPLIASDHPAGVCVISFDQPRRFTGEERTLLVAISGLVAHALERARLFDAEHVRAQELQRGLLPRTLPPLPACTSAARYLPARQGMDVGGDWYDIIPLSGDRVALVIGDVMGHGLPEAATMGRLRTAVHTLADLELPPDEILAHLNDVVSELGDDSYATCLYGVYDPTTGVCAFGCAGHPPPAVVRPDGTVEFPAVASDPPLGAADPPFESVEVTLPENSLLVLYTDGLIESASRDIDAGMAHLAQLLSGAGADDLDGLCERLTAGLVPAQQQSADDAALLVVRVNRLSAESVAVWPLTAEPQAAGEARKLVRAQLSEWGLDDLAMTTELLVSELVGNVVRHAKGPVVLRLLHSRTLICEVSDGSLTTPRIRRASETDEGGRGLQLVAALSQRWGARYTATGKCIWTEQALTGPDSPDALLTFFDQVA